MSAYIARRILLMIPTLLGILFVSFVVVQFAPGGPVERGAWLPPPRLLDVLVLDLGRAPVASRALTRLPELLTRFGGVVLALASSTSARAKR